MLPIHGPASFVNFPFVDTDYGPESIERDTSPNPAGTPPPKAGPPPSAGESRAGSSSRKRSRGATAAGGDGAAPAESDSSVSAGHASDSTDGSAAGDPSRPFLAACHAVMHTLPLTYL